MTLKKLWEMLIDNLNQQLITVWTGSNSTNCRYSTTSPVMQNVGLTFMLGMGQAIGAGIEGQQTANYRRQQLNNGNMDSQYQITDSQ